MTITLVGDELVQVYGVAPNGELAATSELVPVSQISTSPESVGQEAGTSYTFALTDGSRYTQFTSGSAVTATIPPSSSVDFPIGTVLDTEQAGAGVVMWTEGVGVTINSNGGLVASNGQYAVSSAIKVNTDTWTLIGNLA